MTNDYFTITNYHLNVALKHGEHVAKAQIDEGRTDPLTDEELWDTFPQDDIVFLVTGEKIHDVDESYLVLDAFEEGYFYYAGWGETDNG